VNVLGRGPGGESLIDVHTTQFTVGPEPPSTEILGGKLVAAGTPVLQNSTGTVRLAGGRLDAIGSHNLVPEPEILWQLGSGLALLVLLARRRPATLNRSML